MAAIGAGSIYLLKKRTDLGPWTYLLNVVGTVLIIFPVVGIAKKSFPASAVLQARDNGVTPLAATPGPEPDETNPDIYFIILDGYARSDVLQEIYDYDHYCPADERWAACN